MENQTFAESQDFFLIDLLMLRCAAPLGDCHVRIACKACGALPLKGDI